MHELLEGLHLTDVCPKCRSLYRYRRDANGTLVRELCAACHPGQCPLPPKSFPWLPKFIAFTGLAQAGKTTCATWLQEKFGFGLLSFATPLKRMLRALVSESDKEATPYVLCGKTLRHAMQTLGTEWGRKQIGEDMWLRAARQEVERLRLAGAVGITVDDARFDNEAELVREMGGIVIELVRPGLARMEHVSEAGIDPKLVDYGISATTTEELIKQLDGLLTTRA
jgi:hypothetical protein